MYPIQMKDLHQTSVCDEFEFCYRRESEPHTFRTVKFTSRITGKDAYIQFDPYFEVLSQAIAPVRFAAFLNICANAGFLITPNRVALDKFFELAVWGITSLQEVPENAEVTFIATNGAKVEVVSSSTDGEEQTNVN